MVDQITRPGPAGGETRRPAGPGSAPARAENCRQCQAVELDVVPRVHAAVHLMVGRRRSEQVPHGAAVMLRGWNTERDVDAAVVGVVLL